MTAHHEKERIRYRLSGCEKWLVFCEHWTTIKVASSRKSSTHEG